MAVYTDISEIKKQEARLRLILENSPIGVGIINPDGVLMFHNPRFATIFGVDGQDLTGWKTAPLITDWDRRNASYTQFQERGILANQEILYNKFQGDEQIWTLTTWVATEYEGKPARLTWVYDFTEQKETSQALSEAKEQAEGALADLRKAQDRLVQAEKMASLGQLTAGIAHEIKNPLNFVNNFAKLSSELLDEFVEVTEGALKHLSEDDRDDANDLVATLKGNLSKIEGHGKRADGIIKNMLLHSRSGPGECHIVPINELVEESLNLAYHGARAENQEFNVTLQRTLALDAGEIEAFPQDLTRVFLNVMTNGFYATTKRKEAEGEGFEPTLSVTTLDSGETVEVRVRDNGIGMPREVREKLFTPFFTTKPAGEGTGLGLSLSYDIVVKQHGGTINVNSEVDVFTEFTITLPRVLPKEGKPK